MEELSDVSSKLMVLQSEHSRNQTFRLARLPCNFYRPGNYIHTGRSFQSEVPSRNLDLS